MQEAVQQAGLEQPPDRAVRSWLTAEGSVEARAFERRRGPSWREVGHFVENVAIQERIRAKTVYLQTFEGIEEAMKPGENNFLYVVEDVDEESATYVNWNLDRKTTELTRNLERGLRNNVLIPLKQVSPRKGKLLETTFPGITLPPTQP